MASAGFIPRGGQWHRRMDALRWPRPFPRRGTIGICSPSGPSDPEAIARAVATLQALGHEVVVTPGAGDRHSELDYLAGSDQRRASDLNGLFADPSVDLVLCARGGYGAARLLDRIDYDAVRRDPKPLVGYSDITALNLGLLARAGVVSYSGIMATAGDGFGEATLDPRSAASFWSAVSGGADAVQAPPDGRPPSWVRPADTGDPVLGGRLLPVCLTLLESLLSTPYAPSPDGALLLIEDVHEPLYAVDRALTQLRLSGFLDRLAGILVGAFTGAPEDGDLAERVARLAAEMAPARVPVAWGIAYGHIPCRLTLPVGASARFNVETGEFRFVPD